MELGRWRWFAVGFGIPGIMPTAKHSDRTNQSTRSGSVADTKICDGHYPKQEPQLVPVPWKMPP